MVTQGTGGRPRRLGGLFAAAGDTQEGTKILVEAKKLAPQGASVAHSIALIYTARRQYRGDYLVDESRRAELIAVNLRTGEKRGVTTSADGNYAISSLPPGVYWVEFKAPGFSLGTCGRCADVSIGISTGGPCVECHTASLM